MIAVSLPRQKTPVGMVVNQLAHSLVVGVGMEQRSLVCLACWVKRWERVGLP